MSDKTMYAWAPIAHKNEDGSSANLQPGDEVPQELLDSIDKATLKLWYHDGVIRSAKYPENVPPGLSVRTHLLREANKAFEEAQKVGVPDALDPGAESPSAVKPNGESPTAGTATAPQGEEAPSS